MASAQEVRDAAEALLTARANFASAQLAFEAAQATIDSMLTVELANLQAANATFSAAFETAKQSFPDYDLALVALNAANNALSIATPALQEAINGYNGS